MANERTLCENDEPIPPTYDEHAWDEMPEPDDFERVAPHVFGQPEPDELRP